MALYVDGFLLPIPKKRLGEYRRLARLASKVWREHGALEYRECVGDDLAVKGMMSFPRAAAAARRPTARCLDRAPAPLPVPPITCPPGP